MRTDGSDAPVVPAVQANPILLRPRDAARVLGISERLLWSLTARSELPCVRISRRCVRYRLADLEAWAASRASTSREPIPLVCVPKAAP